MSGFFPWSLGRVVAVHTPPRAVDAARTVNPSRRGARRGPPGRLPQP